MGGESTLQVTAKVTASATHLTAAVTAALTATNPWLVVAAIAGMAVVGVAAVVVSNSGNTQKN